MQRLMASLLGGEGKDDDMTSLMMNALLGGAGGAGGDAGIDGEGKGSNHNKMNDFLASMPEMQKAMEEMLLNEGGGGGQGGANNLADMMATLEAIGGAAGAGAEVRWEGLLLS
jgi:predicted PolB exonuclease-like 3'-5' exonuclease